MKGMKKSYFEGKCCWRKGRNFGGSKVKEWFTLAIFITSFLFPPLPFQVSVNWMKIVKPRYTQQCGCNNNNHTECNNYTQKFHHHSNEPFRLFPEREFCRSTQFSQEASSSSSSFHSSLFLVYAEPSNTKKNNEGRGGKKKNKDKIDCLIDETKGYKNAANVYQCSSRQTCCFEYAKPSCCGSKPTLQIM